MSSPLTGVNGTGPVTTVLDATAASSDLLDATADPEVVDMAEQLNISREQAIDLFRNQGLLDDFVGAVALDPGFVAYRGPFAAGSALLIVEPGFETREAFRNPPPGLLVREAEVSANERAAGQGEVQTASEMVAATSFVGVVYDAFDNSYTVWIESGTLTPTMGADIDMAVASLLVSNSSTTVQVKEVAADWADAS